MAYTPLSQIPPARLPGGFTDPRGFEVRTAADGVRVGTVADLLVDQDGGAHQFVVDLGPAGSTRVLVPLDSADVDAARKTAVLRGMTRNDVAGLPAFGAEAGSRTAAPAADARAAGTMQGAQSAQGDAVRLTLAEERLALGTRAVPGGEVGVRKTVQTERVRRTVPVAREEVTVERHPAVGLDAATAQVEVTDDEIRIPIFAEEVVVEKRLVPAEEYIVRKRRVTETRTVEADLRRERLEVDRSGERPDSASDTAPAA